LLEADHVYKDLAEVIVERTTAEWLELCELHSIPASPVPSLDDVVNDPAQHRGVLSDAVHPVVGAYRQINSPVKMSATPPSVRRHAPLVAEHTTEILGELGYSEVDVARLVEEGVVRLPRQRDTH
jgi:crotonobetainyl-CoA:carnitine CoA-transferase CaiB-like acyl-CoA transferase